MNLILTLLAFVTFPLDSSFAGTNPITPSEAKKFEILTEITNSETQETVKATTVLTDNELTFLDIENDANSDIETVITISASDFRSGGSDDGIAAKFNIKEIKNGDLSFESSPNMVVAPNKPASMTLFLKGKSMTLNVKAKRL